MSVSRTIYVGAYLECRATLVDRPVTERALSCPTSKKHNALLEPGHKFCPKCGAPVNVGPATERDFFRFHDLADGTCTTGTEEERNAVFQAFTWIPPESCGNNEVGKDILIFDAGSVRVDADEEAIHTNSELAQPDVFATPSQETLDLLANVCGYSHIRVKHGIIIEVNY